MNRAAIIILRNMDNLLFSLRDDKPYIDYPNHWSPIGGQIEKNETPIEAIKREIKEEIECDEIKNIEFVKMIKVRNNPYCKDHDLYIFKGIIDKKIDELNLTEGQKLGYFNITEFKELKFPEFLKQYIITNKENFF